MCIRDRYYITGDATDREKFQKWAETLEKAIGNPLYHWSHLELQRYFGYTGALNGETAEEVWNLCNKKLQEDSMSVRNIIRQSNVKLICTTDDPIDSLEWHKVIAEDEEFDVQVLPAWRPDKAMNIEKPDYLDYLKKLEEVSQREIKTFEDLKEALKVRMEHFASYGCRASDHALEFVMYRPVSDEELEQIFAKRMRGELVSKEEELKYKTAFMLFVGREYHKRGWAMQLHYGCKRDNNILRYQELGPDVYKRQQLMQEIIEKFNKENEKGIEVVGEEVPWDGGAYSENLFNACMGGGSPDVATWKLTSTPLFVNNDLLTDLTPYIDKWEDKDDIPENIYNIMKEAGGSEEEMYVMP